MFKNVALGIIAGSALAFAGSQIWVAIQYKKSMNGIFDWFNDDGSEDFDTPDVDWDALKQDIGKLME